MLWVIQMALTSPVSKQENIIVTDYMRDEWNVLFTELPDGDGLVQFFDSRKDVAGNGRYITAARVSELESFVKSAGPREYYRTTDGTKIARKRLNNVLKWAKPRVQQSKHRINDPANLLFSAMHSMASQSAC